MNFLKATLFAYLIFLLSSVTYAASTTTASKPKVAFITAAGDIKGPYNHNVYSGLEKAYNEGLVSNITYYISNDTSEYMPQIDNFVKDGYNIIVVVTIFMHDVAIEASKKYPKVKFILVDIDYSKDSEIIPNLYNIAFDQDQISFLAGAIAGLAVDKYYKKLLPNASGSKNIGILQAMDIPNIEAVTNGFKNGVSYVCDDCNVTIDDVNSFTDVYKSYEAATNMYDNEDIDIILPIVGANVVGVLKASNEQQKYIVGTNTDMHLASPFVFFSIIKNLGFAVDETLRSLVTNPSKTEHRKVYNMYNGGTMLSSFYDYDKNITEDMRSKIKEIEEGLEKGSIDVY